MHTAHRPSGVALLVLISAGSATAQTGFTRIADLERVSAVAADGAWVAGITTWPGTSDVTAVRWSAGTGAELLGLMWGSRRSQAFAISGDGQIVVGQVGSGNNGFRWTPSGLEALAFRPRGISVDGNITVGERHEPFLAFYWTPSTGIQHVPVNIGNRSGAYAVSADGRVVVGSVWGVDPIVDLRPYRWDRSEPTATVLPPVPSASTEGFAYSVSPDGAILGGGTLGSPQRAWVWTAEHGYLILPAAAQTNDCRVLGINHDGTMLVGYCTVTASARGVIWTGLGPQGPYQAHHAASFFTERGLVLPNNTTIGAVEAITGDGRVIVGWGWIGTGWLDGFRAEFCYANCDQSTVAPFLNVDDFTCFINRFSEAMMLPHEKQVYHDANCDRSTTPPVLNVEDFTCFINKFAQGCSSP